MTHLPQGAGRGNSSGVIRTGFTRSGRGAWTAPMSLMQAEMAEAPFEQDRPEPIWKALTWAIGIAVLFWLAVSL